MTAERRGPGLVVVVGAELRGVEAALEDGKVLVVVLWAAGAAGVAEYCVLAHRGVCGSWNLEYVRECGGCTYELFVDRVVIMDCW